MTGGLDAPHASVVAHLLEVPRQRFVRHVHLRSEFPLVDLDGIV